MKGSEAAKIQALGLDKMTALELQDYFLTKTPNSGSLKQKWFGKYLQSEVNFQTVTSYMAPEAQELVNDIIGERYRQILIMMIMNAIGNQEPVPPPQKSDN